MDEKRYTGRQVAIFTDAHGLYEPTKAALEDMKKRGINEIYSLGDNIGVGPDPDKVIDLLVEYDVHSVAGNAEEYVRLGIEPFYSYFNAAKKLSHTWTLSKLNEKQIGVIKMMPRTIELVLGGKKIALVHFANDVRIDFDVRSTWSYQRNFDFMGDGTRKNPNASKQFDYTNSEKQIEEIKKIIEMYGIDDPRVKGYLSAREEPLFNGKKASFYDAIFQGHVHWKLYDETDATKFYSIRGVGMAYREDPVNTASYVVLKEHEEGFDMEEVLVIFDREPMIYSMLHSGSPDKTILKFTSVMEEEISNARKRI